MNDALGLVFAYTGGLDMQTLVSHRTAPSVPYGGSYRAIDFLLSNMVNAGIHDVGVVVREGYQSLLDHLSSGRDWDLGRKLGGLALLPPFGYSSMLSRRRLGEPFKGKMDALCSISSYIEKSGRKYVVLGDAHFIMNLRLDPVFDAHIKSGADVTAVCSPEAVGDPVQGTFFRFSSDGRAIGISTTPEQGGMYESLGLFIMERRVLEELINHAAARDQSYFEREVLRDLLHKINIRSYIFNGYVAVMQSVAGYFRHSMDLLNRSVRRELFNRSNPIYTRVRDEAPSYFGDGTQVRNSLIADGCRIEGHVENSILFRGVHVASGATVKNSIIMQGGRVSGNAFLNYIVADKNVTAQRDCIMIGNAGYPVVLKKGSTV